MTNPTSTAMTYFPRQPLLRPSAQPAGTSGSVKSAPRRDVLWGRPLFQAPTLPSPRNIFDPLPFTAARVTHRDTPSRD